MTITNFWSLAPGLSDKILVFRSRKVLHTIPIHQNERNEHIYIEVMNQHYIDDLNVPNIDSNICESICYDIYPEELDIVPTNTSFSNTTFLDLDISVIDGKFISKLYDKRRDFGFKVITFPNLRSNIPNKTSYGTFIGELYRTCKSSTRYEDFIHDVKLLINKLINQKFEKSLLYSCLNRFLRSKPACISKYWHCFNVSEFM